MKIPKRLRTLLDEGLVQEVVQSLMSGKEASVWVVLAEGEYRCAKVYKEAHQRSFRQRATYTEGRRLRGSREQRAVDKGSRYGRARAEDAWQNAEVDMLYRVADAGVRVPRPHLYADGVLIMDLVLDRDGRPAPRLAEVSPGPARARELHAQLVREVVRMLCAGVVHGDLSEYNVLIAWDGPVVIDLPQAIDASSNQNARSMLLRDVQNVTRYLARFAPELHRRRDGPELWTLYEAGALFPDTVPSGTYHEPTRRADPRAVLEEIQVARRRSPRRTE